MSIQSGTSSTSTGATQAAAIPVGQQRIDDATAAAGGYLSEFAQLIAVWSGKVDAHGDLLGKDGVVLTDHSADPAPAKSSDPVGALDLLRTQADQLKRAAAVNALDWQTDLAWPPSGQQRMHSMNMGEGTAQIRLVVPQTAAQGANASHLGFFNFAEVPGGAVLARDITISINGQVVADSTGSGNSAPTFNFTVGNPDGFKALAATFNLNPGDLVTISVRNGANMTAQNGDFLLDFATPNRY